MTVWKSKRSDNNDGTYAYKRATDRWCGRIRLQLPTGERKRFYRYGAGYDKGRAIAKAAIKQLKKKMEQEAEDYKNGVLPSLAEEQPMTLAGWLKEWATNWKPRPTKDTAIRARLVNVKRIVDVLGEDLPLNDVTVHHYFTVLSAMTERELSEYSKRQMFVNFSTALKVAEKREHLAVNFFHKLEERPTPGDEEMRFLTMLEQKQLLAIDNEWSPQWRFLLGSGLRSGELSALTWDYVNLEAGWVHIQRTYQRIKGGWEFGTPKTKKSGRKVTIQSNLIGLLKSIKEQQQLNDKRAKAVDDDDPAKYWNNKHGFVFTSPTGEPIPLHKRWRELQAALKKAEVARCRVHDLRHTYAANQVNGGVNPLELSRAMGHSSTAFTQDCYGHLWDETQDSVAKRSDDILEQLDRWILQDKTQAEEIAAG